MNVNEIIDRLQAERLHSWNLQAQIVAGAEGRFMTQDEDADNSYLEGKIVACDYALGMLMTSEEAVHEYL